MVNTWWELKIFCKNTALLSRTSLLWVPEWQQSMARHRHSLIPTFLMLQVTTLYHLISLYLLPQASQIFNVTGCPSLYLVETKLIVSSRVRVSCHLLMIILCWWCVPGYKPCNPQLVSDRMLHLTAAYEELLRLANERRARLEESRKMWQFYWDMADEEAWIKEKEQIMSSPDLGHDLTSIHLLLTKHKVGF